MNEIDKYVEEELKRIDEEVNRDQDIRDRAAYICEQLKLHPVFRETVNGVDYELAMKMKYNKVLLIARNINKAKIMGNKFIPYTFTAEYDPTNKDISLEDVFKTVVATFIAHVSDRLVIETDEGTQIF